LFGRHSIPSWSQARPKIPRMSADTLLKWYPGIRRPVHPVQHPAPVGVEQPTDEGSRVEVDQVLLPYGHLDLPFVLPAGSVLREETGPVLGEGLDVPAPLVPLLDPTDLVWKDLCHRKLALPEQSGVPLGAGDAKLEDVTRAGREAAVAEVEAEEVGVGPLRQGQRIAATDGTGTSARLTVRSLEGVLTIEVRGPTLPPLPDGASRDPSLPNDLTIIATRPYKLEDQRDFLSCSHFATLLPRPEWRNRQTQWIQNPSPERACGFESRLGHPSQGT
jgi:hypothetical protein